MHTNAQNSHHNSHHSDTSFHSHLSSSHSNSAASSSLYHNNSNNRDSDANGRTHSADEHLGDRYAANDRRFEREYCRPNAGMYSSVQRDYDESDMEDEWKNIHTVRIVAMITSINNHCLSLILK